MGGARLSSVLPFIESPDRDSPGGGAPLYGWSPIRSDPGTREDPVGLSSPEATSPTSATSRTSNTSPTAATSGSAAGKSTDAGNNETATKKSYRPGEQDPKTPPKQEIRTPEVHKPQRTASNPTLRAAGRALMNSAITPIGIAPPALTLSAYPGPGAGLQRQPSFPIVIPTSVPIGLPVPPIPPVHPPVFAPDSNGNSTIPKSTSQNFINAVQMMNLNPNEPGIHASQKVSNRFFSYHRYPSHPIPSCSIHFLWLTPALAQMHREATIALQSRIWGIRRALHEQPDSEESRRSFDSDLGLTTT